MPKRNEDQGDSHKEVPVPDCDGAEHKEGRGGSDGRTSEELVESVQGLAVDFGGGIEGNEHADDGEEHRVLAQKVQLNYL